MICAQRKADCAYIRGGECRILTDTNFTKKCPFYKRTLNPEREHIFQGHEGVFKKIAGYGDIYFVSEYGEVVNNRGQTLRYKWVKDVACVELRFKYNGAIRTPTRPVHLLVAEAFMPVGDTSIIHIDGNPLNCRLDNLKWSEK